MKKVRIEGEFESFGDLATALHLMGSWAHEQGASPDKPRAWVRREYQTANLKARIPEENESIQETAKIFNSASGILGES